MSEQYKNHDQAMSLPQPVSQESGPQQYEKQKTQALETGSPAINSQPPTSASQSQVSLPQGSTVSGGSSANPQIADDVDLIEKEWVERAKRIVEQTKSDPHKQSEELHATKDDYQMKRFNRNSNLGEAA